MKTNSIALALIGTCGLWAQQITDRRSAEIRGGGGEGKCTIEVEVDDVAEVEINGPNAIIRTINGSPASFRRFVCNQSMPNRTSGFRFKGIDGRGRQNLIRSADDGRAIIRIEDSKGGREGYTFDIFWNGSGGGFGGGNSGSVFGNGNGNNNGGGWNNGSTGWGNGGGWNNNSFNFEGGRRGSGSYRDRNGDMRRLDQARVVISNSGNLEVVFQTDRGRFDFSGRVERRQGRRIFAPVSGNGMSGNVEIEMGSNNKVNRIYLREIDLNWSN
jgi:hypothetical protein